MSWLEDFSKKLLAFRLTPTLEDIFQLSGGIIKSLGDLPSTNVIGKWLEDNPRDFFARPEYGSEEVYEQAPGLSFLLPSPIPVMTRRRVLRGFALTCKVPFSGITLHATPRLLLLPHFEQITAFVFSRRELTLFTASVSLHERDWDRVERAEAVAWTYATFIMADDPGAVNAGAFVTDAFSTFLTEQIVKIANRSQNPESHSEPPQPGA